MVTAYNDMLSAHQPYEGFPAVLRDEARRLDIVGVVEDELVLLGRVLGRLAEFAGLEGAVDERHRHGLALAMAEGQAVAAGELRRNVL